MHFCPPHYSKSRNSLFIGFMTNGPIGLRLRGRGEVDESRIELVVNRLILGQLYFTTIYFSSLSPIQMDSKFNPYFADVLVMY